MRPSPKPKRARPALAVLVVLAAATAGILAGSPFASAATFSATTSIATASPAAAELLATTSASPDRLSASTDAGGKLPNSNVEKKGSVKVFVPKSLRAKWSGSTEKKCTKARQSVTITNLTATAVTVTYQGMMLVKLQPNYQFGACFWGTGVGAIVFGLAKSGSELTIHVH